VIFTYVLTIYLRFTSHHSLSSSPLLRKISADFIILFSYINTKYVYHLSLLYPLLMPSSPPTVVTPGPDLVYLSVLHFFTHILTGQEKFALLFHTCIYHALIKLLPHYLFFLCFPDSLVFNSLQCNALYYLHCIICIAVSVFFTL
jgi:hypothetical protein